MAEELRRVDRDEAPHGLYGLRHARQKGERLPKLPAILTGPGVRLVQRIGGSLHAGRPGSDCFSFGLGGARTVVIRLRSHADTKVRRFGSAYRLDKKTDILHEPVPDMASEVPKLAQYVRADHGRFVYSYGILFIGHFGAERDGLSLLGRSVSPEFVARYDLTHVASSWRDAHGRDFCTMIHLWYAEQPEATNRPHTHL